MNDVGRPDVGQLADDCVLRAKEQFDDVIELLGQTKDRIRRGELSGVRDLGSQMTLVVKTLVALGDARGRLDELELGAFGGGIRTMDLDAAKLEVGRRLDRLRAAEHSS